MSEIKNYFSKSSKIIESLNNFEEKILSISDTIYQAYKKDKKILVAGNGGSCSDAEHFVENHNVLIKKNWKTLSALFWSLPAAFTAWSNDFGIIFFKRQVEAHAKEDDIYLISTGGGDEKSGASMSLVYAANEAKKRKLKNPYRHLATIKKIWYRDNSKSDITSTSKKSYCHLHCICEQLEKNFKLYNY